MGNCRIERNLPRRLDFYRPVAVGMLVFDRDGVAVGPVAEVFGAIFRLCLPWQDVWLGIDVVESITPGEYVVLSLATDQIDKAALLRQVRAS